MKVVTNFVEWELNYRPYLEDIYGRLAVLFIEHNESLPGYEYFARFSFRNTKKTIKYNYITNIKKVEALII
jgi:hypothetical protein